MAKRKPILIDGERIEVADSARLADIVPRDVTSVVTYDGTVIPSEDFTRVKVPDGFQTNLSTINKGQ